MSKPRKFRMSTGVELAAAMLTAAGADFSLRRCAAKNDARIAAIAERWGCSRSEVEAQITEWAKRSPMSCADVISVAEKMERERVESALVAYTCRGVW